MNRNRIGEKNRIQHIHLAATRITVFCEGHSLEAFLESDLLQSAVLHQFVIMGEAVTHLDQNLLEKYNYPWRLVRSFRNFIAHEYFGLKMERVWATIEDELPALVDVTERMLESEFD